MMHFCQKLRHVLVASCFFICCFASAQLRLPALVGDHMVLQQNANVTLWGWSAPNQKIQIQVGWQAEALEATADNSGNWSVNVATVTAGGPYSIKISGEDSIELQDVMLGEVWLCSGQSNMFFPLGKDARSSWRTGIIDSEKEIAQAQLPNLRLFTVATAAAQEPLLDVKGHWQQCTPETAADFSAVAYFFGRDLLEDLEVPVGLISSSWGGTKVESWMQKEVLEQHPDFQPILDREELKQHAYKQALAAYNSAQQAGTTPPEKPKKAEANKAPYVLYNAMIHPLLNYKIKGAIWYQGESNADRAYQYRSLFPAMVKNWRDLWEQGDFPFYYVQIAPHHGQTPEIREAQLLALNRIPNSGMVVSADHGNPKDIHPRNKKPIGKRLASWALANTYSKNIAFSGPLYDHYLIKDAVIEIYFKHSNGLNIKGDALKDLEIAGADGVFYKAEAQIENDHLVVFSTAVEQPKAVRFGWKNSPEVLLFNAHGLPASPFRTDDWPQPTMHKL